MQEPETHYTRGKEGHVGYQVVGGGPFDLVFIPTWLSCLDGMWEEPISASWQSLGLETRAGLHTGEIELRHEDVGGIAVHIGARVAARAAAGEVLVSSTVKDLVAGSGLCFVDRGAHNLHGVPGEWRLFAVEG